MIIYNVTVKIDKTVHEDWVKWMKTVHIPDVMKTGYFEGHQMARVLLQDDSEGITYAIQYTCQDMATLQQYTAQAAPALQRDALQRYPDGQMVAFRTLLELID